MIHIVWGLHSPRLFNCIKNVSQLMQEYCSRCEMDLFSKQSFIFVTSYISLLSERDCVHSRFIFVFVSFSVSFLCHFIAFYILSTFAFLAKDKKRFIFCRYAYFSVLVSIKQFLLVNFRNYQNILTTLIYAVYFQGNVFSLKMQLCISKQPKNCKLYFLL